LYEVSEGETLSEIGKAYDVEVATLTSVNALSAADAIRVGDFLILPVDGPAVARLPEPTATPIRLPTPTATPEPIVEAAAEPTSAPATEVAPPVPAAPPPADIADWPYELVRLINEFRAEHGLPPYIYNETLARAAQAHANDCVQRGSCSHTGSDGSSVKERIVRAGYVGTGYAECWAQRQSPQGALDIWLDEIYPQEDGTVEFGPHRRMMLHTWFTEIGVGVAETDWGYYFIADFGRP
ncbi:MAG: CAP domain-containing protein, partial [Anaerolineae bacterium]